MSESLSRHTYRVFEIADKAFSLAIADLSSTEEGLIRHEETIDMLALTVAMLNASRGLAWEHYCETIDWYPEDWNIENRSDTEMLQQHVRTMRDSSGQLSLARFGTASSIDASRYRKLAEESMPD